MSFGLLTSLHPATTFWPNHLLLYVACPVCGMSPKPPRNSGLVSAPLWLAHFSSFWVNADHHKACFGPGTEINKEGDSRNDRGWVQKPCHTVCWLCWASWHRPMLCKLFICTQIAFHSDAKRVGSDAARGRYVHKSCYQIIGLPCKPPVHALKFYSSIYIYSHRPAILLHNKQNCCQIIFKATIIFLITSVIISELSCNDSHIKVSIFFFPPTSTLSHPHPPK